MSVVAIVPDWPARPRTGGEYVERVILSELASLTDVHLVAVQDPGADAPNLPALASVTVCPRVRVRRGSRLLSPLPTVALWSRGQDARARLAKIVATVTPTHVLVSRTYTAVNLPAALECPILLLTQNVEHRRLRDLPTGPNPLRMVWQRLQAKRMQHLERAILARAAATLVLSRRDADLVRAMGIEREVIEVPPLPDPDLFLVTGCRPANQILFLGSLGYPPNYRAAMELIAVVLPRVRSSVSSARLIIAGSSPPPDLVRLVRERADVTLLGDFADAREIFSQASVFVAPLPVQEGLSVKTLNAFAAATPVVATEAVIASLGATAGQHALAATTPAETADAIVALLCDDSRREALGNAARQFVRERFSPEASRQALQYALSCN